ncbi:Spo0E family sporulation regulatory protein-aspartic acid phosphatase [Brevibacillus sp. NRS-1366]|uniref:Spo0E family sporulation regulatory protein-aspartic acid phosphatase n=1 Tax=Brevibacillus sp. NRS-1366 TaxID=3233899 RepID=UPI003D1A34D3
MGPHDIECLDLKIEALRNELNSFAQSFNLTAPLIISLSQRIDFYLNIRRKMLTYHKQNAKQVNVSLLNKSQQMINS